MAEDDLVTFRFFPSSIQTYLHVRFQVSLVIPPHGSRNRRPRIPEGQHTLDVVAFELLARFWVKNNRVDTEEWYRR